MCLKGADRQFFKRTSAIFEPRKLRSKTTKARKPRGKAAKTTKSAKTRNISLEALLTSLITEQIVFCSVAFGFCSFTSRFLRFYLAVFTVFPVFVVFAAQRLRRSFYCNKLVTICEHFIMPFSINIF